MEPTQQLHHRFRHQNLLASPLFRLPTELALKILEHAVEPDDESLPSPRSGPTLLVLTPICHELQNIGMNTPLLWSTVDFVPIKTLTTERQWPNADRDRRETVWTQLEGHTFNGRSPLPCV